MFTGGTKEATQKTRSLMKNSQKEKMRAHLPFQLSDQEGPVHLLFGTPMLLLTWPDSEAVNDELSALILELEQSQPSMDQSNRGGWQSPKTLQTLRHPALTQLISWIDIGAYLISSALVGEEAIDQLPEKWRVSAWANVNRGGHFNSIHYHVGGFWSGVYYVATGPGDPQDSAGAIGFRSPSLAGMVASNIQAPEILQAAFRQEISLRPQPGMMLIFPSWLEHWVNPHADPDPRISVAFDISFRKA
jgi:uncharacterized protein (TIGR02466 family)